MQAESSPRLGRDPCPHPGPRRIFPVSGAARPLAPRRCPSLTGRGHHPTPGSGLFLSGGQMRAQLGEQSKGLPATEVRVPLVKGRNPAPGKALRTRLAGAVKGHPG